MRLRSIYVKTNEEHYKLYNGYVNKWNEILGRLKTSYKTKAEGTYSEYRKLKRQETFNANGTLLHEIFFSSSWGDGQAGSAASRSPPALPRRDELAPWFD